jgi:hypothetical protein
LIKYSAREVLLHEPDHLLLCGDYIDDAGDRMRRPDEQVVPVVREAVADSIDANSRAADSGRRGSSRWPQWLKDSSSDALHAVRLGGQPELAGKGQSLEVVKVRTAAFSYFVRKLLKLNELRRSVNDCLC